MEFPELRHRKISLQKVFPILQYLTSNPRKTRYAIERKSKLGLDRRTVQGAVEILERAGCIRAVDTRTFKNGKKSRRYDVTPQGIVTLLQGHPEHVKLSMNDVSIIAKKRTSFLPLIFRKWDDFNSKDLETTAYEFLLYAAKCAVDEIRQLERVSNDKHFLPFPSSRKQESVLRHDIYEFMFLQAWNFDGMANSEQKKTRDKWLNFLRENHDLSTMAIQEAELRIQEKKRDLRFYEQWHAYFTGDFPAPPVKGQRSDTLDEYYAIIRSIQTEALDNNKQPPTEREIISDPRMAYD